jgi:adenylosuccinate synthase
VIHAVIGANFGDEGKGLVTDFLSTPESLVVRFNGGAQAGHTVVTPDGQRHVFSHVGAGALRGAVTCLSRFFVVNPFQFVKELAMLDAQLGLAPAVYVDPLARVTTPWDMVINQAVERTRGDQRHGSCGLGINETVTRSEQERYALPVWALLSERDTRVKLRLIRDEWVPQRTAQLGIELPAVDNMIVEAFMHAANEFIIKTRLRADSLAVSTAAHVVFEGAQGLGLDEERGAFPHVTRSRTGLDNVIAILRGSKRIEPVTAYYVTRTYLTRHGAGPLDGEVSGHPFGWVGPETNVENEFQGTFRYAPLDVDGLRERLVLDRRDGVRQRLVVTCVDQCDGFDADRLAGEVGVPVALTSGGPTRDHINLRSESGRSMVKSR